VGNVKIRYYVTRPNENTGKVWGYWAPCLKRRNPKTGKIEPTRMAELGFRLVDCGEDGPLAWAIAQRWNAQWDAVRRGQASNAAAAPGARIYPPNSLGEAYSRFKKTAEWLKKPKRTKEDWERGWAHIDPIFGDVDPRTVALEDLDLWYSDIQGLLQRIGVREAHRAMKIWRALWRVIARMNAPHGEKYCKADEDPSLGIRRQTPTPRNKRWNYDEAVRLVKRAIRMEKIGCAAALATLWDTMFSPVDVRGLTPADLKRDSQGPYFSIDRAKTGQPAIGTLGPRARILLRYYLDHLGFELHQDAPIFRTAGAAPGPNGGRRWTPQPYTKDTLAADFRLVREAEFPGDRRQLMDFRRSGAVEAVAGEVKPAALAGKMANTIDKNAELQRTYLPGSPTIVRMADAARELGRTRLKGKES
jgi:hypothetical protein